MSGVYRQGNRWRVVVDGGTDGTGKRRQIVRLVQGSKAEAEIYRAKLLAQVGLPVRDYDATVAHLLEAWLAHTKKSPGTMEDYRRVVSSYLIPEFGRTKLIRLQPSDIDRFYRSLEDTLGPARINRIHTVFRSALKQGVRWQWIATNPAIHASPPSVPKPEIEAPSTADVATLLAYASKHDQQLFTFVCLAAATGARRGELCGLQWQDVGSDSLRIARSVSVLSGSVEIKETKSRRVRVVALDAASLAVVAAHRLRQREMALAWGASVEPTSFLFCRDGFPWISWRGDVVGHRFAKLRVRAGLESVRLHDLRHYVASQLIGAGVDPVTVAGRLGHAKPSMTLDMYASFLPARDRESADLLARLLRDA